MNHLRGMKSMPLLLLLLCAFHLGNAQAVHSATFLLALPDSVFYSSRDTSHFCYELRSPHKRQELIDSNELWFSDDSICSEWSTLQQNQPTQMSFSTQISCTGGNSSGATDFSLLVFTTKQGTQICAVVIEYSSGFNYGVEFLGLYQFSPNATLEFVAPNAFNLFVPDITQFLHGDSLKSNPRRVNDHALSFQSSETGLIFQVFDRSDCANMTQYTTLKFDWDGNGFKQHWIEHRN